MNSPPISFFFLQSSRFLRPLPSVTLIQLPLDLRVGAVGGRRSTEQRRPLWSILLTKGAEEQSSSRVAEFHLLPVLDSEQGFCSSLPKLCLAALFRSWRDTTHWWVSIWWTDLWEGKSSVLLTQPDCSTEFLGNKVVCDNCCYWNR